ncbi:MAG: insulinase family protein [Alphaproteobacteria bacterium]|nr:insulinase family protein [Alphaproteobacteria bacterium]
MRARLWCGLLALAALLSMALPVRSAVYNPESFTLANGLQVVVVSNHRVPIVTHMVWYKVGAADEPPGKSGIAHFLEHLMFKGTKSHAPGAFSKEIARNGGRENAFTGADYTGYFQDVAADRLELVMRMEADRMANLVILDAEVAPEREVILEERRSRTDNSPAAQLREHAQAALYLAHPYRIPIIGWEHEIRGLTARDAADFYERHYAPNNAILVVAGDVSAARVRELAEQYYGPIPPKAIAPRVRVSEPPHLSPRRVSLESARAGRPSWTRSYIAPSHRKGETQHAYALQVLAQILDGGATSRLYKALAVEAKIVNSVSAYYDPGAYDYGSFGFSATPRLGGKIEEVEAAIDGEIARLLAQGVTEDEVARAIKQLQAAAVFARDSMRGAARALGGALVVGRTIDDVENWPERIGAVTKAEVDAAARYVLKLTHSVTSLLLPKPAL